MNFSEKDIKQINNNALTIEKINGQIELIKSGMAFSNLKKAATIGEGILKVEDETAYINIFETKQNAISTVKFVPASGAASRMFKFLFSFLKDYNTSETLEAFIERTDNKAISKFADHIEQLPFFNDVIHKATSNYNTLSPDEKCVEFVKIMLNEDQLNYGFFPKGLLPFHQYDDTISTAFEEHFFEAALYASSNNKANLHFTISEAHKEKFDNALQTIKARVEAKTNTTFNVSFSYQKQSTETIAIKADDTLFREKNGDLLFRPSGHGALLENLNDLDYDLVFVKNIDNVVVKNQHEAISNSKKMLAGVLLEIQEAAFSSLNELDNKSISEEEILKIAGFLSKKMNVVIDTEFDDFNLEKKKAYLQDKLNRPIRICGMVKNEGEPGGGPFWVEDEKGITSLQIVESAQIDSANKNQLEILKNATHFNPVDLVCGIKNYKGENFNLKTFVDHNTSFITMKSKDGIDIKALELPGLWNGSMAFWNTIFVEVPLTTFNPVKTVNDLLKSAHQAS